MNRYTIIPSSLQYKSAPFVDQEISLSLEQQSQEIVGYDRSQSISLAQLYSDERQRCTIFRPTFKINYLYSNTYTGTTSYPPFKNNLYYVDPIESKSQGPNGKWVGFPQYYEFDFYRPNANDQHFIYQSKSAYTYNWMYYVSYPFNNNYNKKLSYVLNNTTLTWTASEGIPFYIKNSTQNGSNIIVFQCLSPHGLSVGEYVELSFNYNNINLFQVDSLGNGLVGSDEYIFNIYDVGYTGATFAKDTTGTFKRVINSDNVLETKSKYYVRENKILTNLEDCVMTKNAFEKNVFIEQKKFEYSSITPNNVSRISQKTSSNTFNVTVKKDIDLVNKLDNQKRPISELFLTIINKGYSGYFNRPSPNSKTALKQGWEFNLTNLTNSWWANSNADSNTNIETLSYTLTNGGITKTFYYNQNLKVDDVIDGDFCEWNDYEQLERVVSPYYHKIKYNNDVFTIESPPTDNPFGFYYKPHNSMNIRVFSDYIETGDIQTVDGVPSYAYFSNSDQQFRWRDLYGYGFIDNLGRGVDYPFLNLSQYPFKEIQFRLIPEGINYNNKLTGVSIPVKPLTDGCE